MHNFELLKNVLNSIVPLSDENWKMLVPHLQVRELEAGEYLLHKGEVCDYIAFIETGAMRAFYTKDEELEVNLLLRASQEFITDYESIIGQSPSELSIQAVTTSKIIVFSSDKMNALYEHSFYWNKLGRLMTENIYIVCKKRAKDLLFLTPEERYLSLLEEAPDFFQKYPLKQIVRYLGITPQSLSRIRACLAREPQRL